MCCCLFFCSCELVKCQQLQQKYHPSWKSPSGQARLKSLGVVLLCLYLTRMYPGKTWVGKISLNSLRINTRKLWQRRRLAIAIVNLNVLSYGLKFVFELKIPFSISLGCMASLFELWHQVCCFSSSRKIKCALQFSKVHSPGSNLPSMKYQVATQVQTWWQKNQKNETQQIFTWKPRLTEIINHDTVMTNWAKWSPKSPLF